MASRRNMLAVFFLLGISVFLSFYGSNKVEWAHIYTYMIASDDLQIRAEPVIERTRNASTALLERNGTEIVVETLEENDDKRLEERERTEKAEEQAEEEKKRPQLLELGPIFYNFFVPTNRSENAIRIANEQMIQRNMSSSNESLLLYTLIGLENVTNSFCQPNCEMRQYLPVGDEVDTLQAVWNYCQNHPHQLVTYLHDRGSFHSTRMNEKSRRFGTKSALECRSLMMADQEEECNACTSMFNLFPQYHGSANMWTAKCSYVRGLYEPKRYSASMESMYKETLLNLNETKYTCLRPQSLAENHVGLYRYAPERWIFSHPDVEPCDTLPFTRLTDVPFHLKQQQNWKGLLHRAPRAGSAGLQGNTNSYARLVGRLYEWQFMYQKAPKKTSWIWRIYRGYENGNEDWMERCLNETGTLLEDDVTTKLLHDLQPRDEE